MELLSNTNTEGTAEQKLRKHFGNMVVNKSASHARLFLNKSIPSFIRDWMLMRFSDSTGQADVAGMEAYINRIMPAESDWQNKIAEMVYEGKTVKILTKIKIDIDVKEKQLFFSSPLLKFPQHKGEAAADWSVVEKNRHYLLTASDVWGIVEIGFQKSNDKNLFKLLQFTPFCPYRSDVGYFIRMRQYFTIEEWIDVILGAADYNAAGYTAASQKLSTLKRLLPFVEKRLNLVELAPKETGKSYMFSRLSKYGWLISGGSITRAKMFYDIAKKTSGLVARYDFVALDEIQSVRFPDPAEMQGALEGYLESGEFAVGDHRGTGEAGFILLGNISMDDMDVNRDMFVGLPDIFHESALVDRFHGFIKGWEMPKMKENMKASGLALNTEYFTEILHLLREESIYRTVVEQLLDVPKESAARDTEAVKRLCTAFLKLLFPHALDASMVNIDEFEQYCLRPAIEMRGVIKKQFGMIDPAEFRNAQMPAITVRPQYQKHGDML